MSDVRYLASPELKGRATGSPELEKAARFIEAKFQSFGLKPVELARFRWCSARTWVPAIIPGTRVRVERDFVPFSFSSSGHLEAPVVFAGYGITDEGKQLRRLRGRRCDGQDRPDFPASAA